MFEKKKGRNDYENGRGKSMSSVCSTQFTYKQSWPEENRWRDPARAHNQKKGAKHWKKEREREIIKGTNGIIHLSQQPANNKKCNCWFSGSENPIARIVDHYDMKCLFFSVPLVRLIHFFLGRFHRRRPLFASIRASLNPLPSRQIFSIINFIFGFIYSDAISPCQHPVKVLQINPIEILKPKVGYLTFSRLFLS